MIHIRSFQADDLPRLRELTVDAFDGVSIDQGIEREFGPIYGHDWRWRKARDVDADVRRDASGVFVAVLADNPGTIVGVISSWQDLEAGLGHIPNLAVAAGYRGRGIGRSLICHVLTHFRRSGLTHARIETLTQNETGNALYRSVGFREVARQVHFALDLRESGDEHTQGQDTQA